MRFLELFLQFLTVSRLFTQKQMIHADGNAARLSEPRSYRGGCSEVHRGCSRSLMTKWGGKHESFHNERSRCFIVDLIKTNVLVLRVQLGAGSFPLEFLCTESTYLNERTTEHVLSLYHLQSGPAAQNS